MDSDPPPTPPDVSELDVASIDRGEAFDYSADTNTYRASFDSDATSVSMAVVSTVAVVTETEPTALPPLNATVNPDALETLVERRDRDPSRNDVRIAFVYAGCTVTVHSYGIIAVQPAEPDEGVPAGGVESDGE